MLTGKQLNRQIRQIGFVLVLTALLFLMVAELSYFISSALGAFTLYMLLRVPHARLVGRGWGKLPATVTMMAAAFLALTLVTGGAVLIVLPKIKAFDPQVLIDNVNSLHTLVLDKTGYDIFSKDMTDRALSSIGAAVPDIFTTTGSILVNVLMCFVLLYFMLQTNHLMEEAFTAGLPFRDDSIALLRHETHNIVVSNAIGIPVVILGHALMSGLAYWILGAGNPMVWGLITGLCGLLPVVGTAIVWVPLAVNMMIGDQVWQGIVLIAYGALVISNVDNLLRIVLMKRYANVHPLITIFGIILGLNLFGFMGIIFGPLMISGFLLLIKIYRSEYLEDEPAPPAETTKS